MAAALHPDGRRRHVSGIQIADAERNSSYWKANEAQTPDTALFFLATAKPDYLSVAPGGSAYMTDSALLPRGRKSSASAARAVIPASYPRRLSHLLPAGLHRPQLSEVLERLLDIHEDHGVQGPDEADRHGSGLPDNNYLSNEVRVPVTLMETNACSPLATNAIRGNIWDNFSSESYKNLPSVGKVMIHDPFTGAPSWYDMPGGGRGYTRPASLISLWSTAPYLQNNSVVT